MVDAFDTTASYGVDCHSYADDMQLYLSSHHINVPVTVAQDGSLQVAECISRLDRWMTLN